jgi:hypothetical protein
MTGERDKVREAAVGGTGGGSFHRRSPYPGVENRSISRQSLSVGGGVFCGIGGRLDVMTGADGDEGPGSGRDAGGCVAVVRRRARGFVSQVAGALQALAHDAPQRHPAWAAVSVEITDEAAAYLTLCGTTNISFYGIYFFDIDAKLRREGRRPLILAQPKHDPKIVENLDSFAC